MADNERRRSLRWRARLGLGVISIIPTLILVWAYCPPEMAVTELELAAAPWDDPQGWQALHIRLESPARLRRGEMGKVRLVIQPTELVGRSSRSPLRLEARLVLPGVDVDPAGEIQLGLASTGRTSVAWEVVAREPGDYQGTAWTYLSRQSAEDDAVWTPVSAQELTIRAMGGGVAPLPTIRRLAVALTSFTILLWLAAIIRKKKQAIGG